MSEIRIKDNESLESALRRFKRQCAKSGVLAEVRKREHYEKPSVKRKKNQKYAAPYGFIKKCRVHLNITDSIDPLYVLSHQICHIA